MWRCRHFREGAPELPTHPSYPPRAVSWGTAKSRLPCGGCVELTRQRGGGEINVCKGPEVAGGKDD